MKKRVFEEIEKNKAHIFECAQKVLENPELMPGAIMAATVIDLLSNNAEKAEEIIKKYNENKGE